MAISRIRGEQIKQEVLNNKHIASDAAIAESKLNINWASRYQQTLITKKVVDFVQVNSSVVGGVNELDVTATIPNTVPNVLSEQTGEGVIVDSPKNKAPLRLAVNGDPLVDVDGTEVYGRMTFVASPDGGVTPAKYVLKFYSMVGAVETAYTMPANTTIDWQYAKRFNLDTVSEMFAANEKFVESAADATAHLNIDQLAKDLYGAGFTLDRDGNGNLGTSLVQQIADEITARQTADTAIRNDLTSTVAGKGASLIGVEDAGGNYTSSNLEGVLTEIDSRLDSLSSGGSTTGAEVEAARKSTALTGVEVTHASLDARIEAGETSIKSTKDEVEVARNGAASLDARLDAMQAEIDAEETARATADTQHAADLAATTIGKGAALIGIEDAGAKITATTVEGALAEIADRATAVEGRATTIETEVQAARKSTALTGVEVTHASVDVRLEATETVVKASKDEIETARNGAASLDARLDAMQSEIDAEETRAAAAETALDGRVDLLETEVQTSRGTEASLDVRLDRALNENGTLKQGTKIHAHKKAYYQSTGGETSVALSSFNVAGLPNYQVADGSLDVFVNGIFQNAGLHYEEVVGGASINFSVGGDGTALVAGDIVTITYYINNAE